MNVLIIDDEHRRIKPLVDYMEVVCSWKVRLALGPKQAVAILSDEARPDFQIVILDIMMDPEGIVERAASDGGRNTGALLIGKLRLYLRKTPILIYTAKIDTEDLKSDERIAAVVQKPSTAKKVVSTVQSVLEASEQ